jgi:mannose-1-phosphate guanylyltransferase
MNAMVLAAGRGTRLRAAEPDVPKVLVDIAGKPLLARQLCYLEGQGISRVVVNAHYLASQVLDFARQHTGSLELVVIVEDQLLGTAGGVRNALDHLGEEPFFVLYGDVLTEEPLAPVLEHHTRQEAAATLAAYESADASEKGTIEVDSSDHITQFIEKGAIREGDIALINAGIYVLQPSFARRIPSDRVLDFGHDVFPRALERGERLAVYRLSRPVIDVGVPFALKLAREVHQAK